MLRRCKRDADKRPVVICLTCVYLLTVHLFEMFFCQCFSHLLEDLLLKALLRNDDSNHEFGFDAEAKNAINVSTNHFQMHQSRKHFLELV